MSDWDEETFDEAVHFDRHDTLNLEQSIWWHSARYGWIRVEDMHERHKVNAARMLHRQWGSAVVRTKLYKALIGEGEKMGTRTRTVVGTKKVTAKADALEALALKNYEEAQRLRTILESEPMAEDETEAVVIQWKETFGRTILGTTTQEYTYVAVKPATSDYWYATDGRIDANTRKPIAYTWEELTNRFHAIRHNDFWVANGWDHSGGE